MSAGAGHENRDDFSPAAEEPQRPPEQGRANEPSSDPVDSRDFAAKLDVDPDRDDVKG